MNSAIQDIYSWYIFSNKWYCNDIVFYICEVEGLFKWFAHEFVCPIVREGTRKSWIFQYFVEVDPCAVASMLAVLKGIIFGCRLLISFQVGMLMIFNSAPESI